MRLRSYYFISGYTRMNEEPIIRLPTSNAMALASSFPLLYSV